MFICYTSITNVPDPTTVSSISFEVLNFFMNLYFKYPNNKLIGTFDLHLLHSFYYSPKTKHFNSTSITENDSVPSVLWF